MTKIYTSALFTLCSAMLFAQTAMVQVIHNSPTPGTTAGPVVDIYLNGNSDPAAPDIPDLAYRFATPFVELAAGATQIHVVADGGNPATDTVLFAEAMLMAGETYSVIAAGIVGSNDAPFTLAIKDGVSMASTPGNNDLLIFHGSPDAPAVIIDAKDVANLESQLEFGEFGETRTVPNDDYIVDVRPGNDTNAIVARFQAPLATLGLDGGAATIFASGLLGDTPAFGIFATLPNGVTVPLPDTAIAQLQIIHNSPFAVSEGGPAVDVWVNGTPPDGNGPLAGIQFREATPYIELPGDVDFTFDVVPAGADISESIFNLPAGELGNSSLNIVAHGIAGSVSQPFNLALLPNARSFGSSADNTDLAVFHGSPDAPGVDVDVLTAGTIVDNVEFGSFNSEGYLSVPAAQYYLGIRPDMAPVALATFNADLSGLGGGAATVFASGFVANAQGSPFGLFAALPNGTVVELPAENVARVQVVHNAPVAELVDIWLGTSRLVPDFEYQTATPFVTLSIDSSISITAPGAPDTSGNFLTIPPNTLQPGETYYVTARGDMLSNFGVSVFDQARESAVGGAGIDLQAFHGSPDAPAVDVNARNVATLFPSLVPNEYGADYVNVPEDLYLIDITFPGETAPLFTFVADLNGLEGSSVLALASGYVTASQDGDSAFQLLVALPDGTVQPLPRVELAFANIIHASPAAAADSVDVYIGDALAIDNFPYLGATGYTVIPTNEDISINLKTSTGPEDGVVLEIPAGTLSTDSIHIVIVHGDGTDDFPFEVSFIDNARPSNSVAGAIDVIAFHGIPGVGAVDVRNGANFEFPTLIPNLGYSQFSDYLLFPEVSFFLRFTGAGSPDAIATFNNDILEEDQSVLLLATGSVADGDYNLFVVLPDGNVFSSVPVGLAQIIHNAPVAAVDPADIWVTNAGLGIEQKVVDALPFREATTSYYPTRIPFDVGIAPGGSTSASQSAVTFPFTFIDGADYTITAIGDGDAQPFNLAVQDATRFTARDGEFDVQVLHGSPDAPTVNILANGETAVSSLEYGTYQGYLGLGNAAIEISVADETETTIVGTYDAPVDSWIANGNTSGTIFASGYLTPGTDQPGFELWVAFANGETEMLTVVSSINELERLLTGMSISPNPARGQTFINYSLEETMDIQMRVIGMDGRIVEQLDLGTQGQGVHTVDLQVYDLSPGTYSVQMINKRGSVTKRMVVVN